MRARRTPRTTDAAIAIIATAASVALAGCGIGVEPVFGPSGPAGAAAPSAAPTARAPRVVMIIRHGEKPDGSAHGVDAQGDEDDSSLTEVGWTRANRLADLFDPADGPPRPGLVRPRAVYAAGANDDGEGRRTRETVAPLADRLGVPVNTDFGRGDEAALVEQVSAAPGPTLISWQHGGITDIAGAFPHVRPDPPKEWPDDRYDVVWTLTETTDGWHFAQLPERVLPQDKIRVVGH